MENYQNSRTLNKTPPYEMPPILINKAADQSSAVESIVKLLKFLPVFLT